MARQTQGRIFKRGKKGIFYLQYYVNGKQFVVTLKDDAGKSITREEEAKIAADKVLHPVRAANRAEQLRQIREAVESAEDKAERLEAEKAAADAAAATRAADARATIAAGWSMFMGCPKRPASCKRYPAGDIPRNTTAGNYCGYYQRFSEWMTDHKVNLLSEVTPAKAAAYMAAVRKECASGTFNKYLQFYNCFFDTLLAAKRITGENPFAEIDRAEHHYNSKKPLTVEQIGRLIDTATGEMRLLIALGYFTGLRRGDCCTLQWREVDLLRGVIERIPRKIEHRVKDPNQAMVKVGIAPYLLQMLAEIPETQRTGYVLPQFAETYLSGHEWKVNRQIVDHFAACGIEVHRAGTGIAKVIDPETGKCERDAKTGKRKTTGTRAVVEVGFHSLRYSYISHNAEMGTPAAIIQRNAGHANPAMTEHYTLISDQAAQQYAAKLTLPSAAAPALTAGEEPERAQLRALADVLTIDEVREILNHYRRA